MTWTPEATASAEAFLRRSAADYASELRSVASDYGDLPREAHCDIAALRRKRVSYEAERRIVEAHQAGEEVLLRDYI